MSRRKSKPRRMRPAEPTWDGWTRGSLRRAVHAADAKRRKRAAQ